MKDWDTGPEINLSYPPRMSDPKTRTEDKDNNRCKTQYEGKAKRTEERIAPKKKQTTMSRQDSVLRMGLRCCNRLIWPSVGQRHACAHQLWKDSKYRIDRFTEPVRAIALRTPRSTKVRRKLENRGGEGGVGGVPQEKTEI